MAGTITHYFFAKDVMNNFYEKKDYAFIDDCIGIFAQNMDPFNFYSIYLPFIKGSGEIRKFSNIAHTTNIDVFFKTLFNYAKEKKLYKDAEVTSFIYGMITHYVLDSMIHPYVEYKCGSLEKGKKETYKYNAKHHEMETCLDIYMLGKKGYNYKKFKSYKEIFKINKIDDNLSELIDYTYKKVYNFNNFSNFYLKSVKDMKISFRLFRYDPFGIKKYMYYCFDFFTPKYILNSKFLSYSYIPSDFDFFLNNNKDIWYYPYDTSVYYDYSFDEIYENAINRCVSLIEKVHDYIYYDEKIDIDGLFSLSYCSGLNWKLTKKKPIYYF